MVDEGLLVECPVGTDMAGLRDQCWQALTKWVTERLNGLQILNVRLDFSLFLHQRPLNSNDQPLTSLQVTWQAVDAPTVTVKAAVEVLERARSNLGKTALFEVTRHAWQSIPIMSCTDTVGLAQYILWGGCADEHANAAEFEIEGEEKRNYFANTIPRSQVVSSLPKWLVKGVRKPLSDRDLRRVQMRARDPYVGQVAELILALRALPPTDDFLNSIQNDSEGEFIGYGAYLRWTSDDSTLDVCDAQLNERFQDGTGFEVAGAQQLPLEQSSLGDFLAEIEPLLKRASLVDQLIQQLNRQ